MPGSSHFVKDVFLFENVGAAIGRPENIPLTNLGMMVKQVIYDITRHYPAITVVHAVVMPNHIHLMLQINADIDGRPVAAPTISTVINQMKGVISKQAGFSVWQKGFYDHVIRKARTAPAFCYTSTVKIRNPFYIFRCIRLYQQWGKLRLPKKFFCSEQPLRLLSVPALWVCFAASPKGGGRCHPHKLHLDGQAAWRFLWGRRYAVRRD